MNVLLMTAVAALLCGCVRIYVASPEVFSLREPPGVKVARVITDLRSLGTALEAHYVDNNTYPTANEKDIMVESVALANVERLESQMVNYVRRVSPEDPWGRPYLYWSSGKSYVLLSTGSDRLIADPQAFLNLLNAASADRAFVRTTNTDCLEDEIVFAGGVFIQMPKYSASECHKQK